MVGEHLCPSCLSIQSLVAENKRLRAALSALFVATRRLKLKQGILEAAEAALRGEEVQGG